MTHQSRQTAASNDLSSVDTKANSLGIGEFLQSPQQSLHPRPPHGEEGADVVLAFANSGIEIEGTELTTLRYLHEKRKKQKSRVLSGRVFTLSDVHAVFLILMSTSQAW